MTKSNGRALLVGSIALASSWTAGGWPACGSRLPSFPGLERVECVVKEGVILSRHIGATPPAPYASELDRRLVVSGFAARSDEEGERVSSARVEREITDYFSELAPPYKEKLELVSKKSAIYRTWTVHSSDLQYVSQGANRGFVLKCAMAVTSLNGTAAGLAECFPLEERATFLRSLDTMTEWLEELRK